MFLHNTVHCSQCGPLLTYPSPAEREYRTARRLFSRDKTAPLAASSLLESITYVCIELRGLRNPLAERRPGFPPPGYVFVLLQFNFAAL